MNQLKKNTQQSFEKVKQDMLYIFQELDNLKQNQQKLIKFIEILNENQQKLTIEENSEIVGARTSKKFHRNSCPFAQNIKSDNLMIFNSKDQALHLGLKPCSCMV